MGKVKRFGNLHARVIKPRPGGLFTYEQVICGQVKVGELRLMGVLGERDLWLLLAPLLRENDLPIYHAPLSGIL
jgi:hypothetical protein